MALPISSQEHLLICLLLVRIIFFADHQDRAVCVPYDRVRDTAHQRETLPIRARFTPPRPRLPSTISPIPISSPTARIPWSGRAILKWAPATVPPASCTRLTCSSSNRCPICLISSSCAFSVLKPIVPYSEASCVRKMKVTCSSEPVLSARSTAVRAAKYASLEPSVASRIFVGKILIWSPQDMLLYLSLLGSLREADCIV